MELWRKFIDPADWLAAQCMFPQEPWRYYIHPQGEYAPQAWDHFQSAFAWVKELAGSRVGNSVEDLHLRDLLYIHALVLSGHPPLWPKALLRYQPIFNYRSSDEIHRVFESGSCHYLNGDGLNLRVEGFWPRGSHSLEFFARCRSVAAVSYEKDPLRWEEAYDGLRVMLHSRVPPSSGDWLVYFLTRPQDLVPQIEQVLLWYNLRATELLRCAKEGLTRQRVLDLAVKMQRYVDIAQFGFDGSGRTSALVLDYVCMRFGYSPSKPTLYEAYGQAWGNGTYLPMDDAIQLFQ